MDRGIRKAIERRALTAAGGAIARRDVSQVLRRCALFRLKSLAVLLTTVHCFYPSFARSADAEFPISFSFPTYLDFATQSGASRGNDSGGAVGACAVRWFIYAERTCSRGRLYHD